MQKKIWVYAGSFDPVTNGHIDIIERATKLCDKLIIAVMINSNKKPFFTLEERVGLLKCALKDHDHVEIDCFSGLLVDFMKQKNATALIKGLRAVSDYEYELQMAQLNKTLDHNIETLFLMSDLKYSFLSSSAVKELAKYNANIDGLVPDCIIENIQEKFKNRGG